VGQDPESGEVHHLGGDAGETVIAENVFLKPLFCKTSFETGRDRISMISTHPVDSDGIKH
jgi:hypothetical protein